MIKIECEGESDRTCLREVTHSKRLSVYSACRAFVGGGGGGLCVSACGVGARGVCSPSCYVSVPVNQVCVCECVWRLSLIKVACMIANARMGRNLHPQKGDVRGGGEGGGLVCHTDPRPDPQ